MSHSYKTLHNNPNERYRVLYPWVYYDNAFTNDELDRMSTYFEMNGIERATTIGNAIVKEDGSIDTDQNTNEEIRRSNVMFYAKNENTAWIFDRLNGVIEWINNNFYNFDLNGYGVFQYTEYNDFEKGEYNFHTDTIMSQNMPMTMMETRKLSIVMPLNQPGIDFEGGDFQINQGQEKDAMTIPLNRGRIIAFPSWMIHRVSPVTKGKRKSLVIWVSGPKFR